MNRKIKIKKGQDATESIVKKMLYNLIAFGKVTTTVKRAKILKSAIDRLVYKAQTRSEANRNVLLKRLSNSQAIKKLVDEIAPRYIGRTGGFVSLKRLGRRLSDGAEVAQIEWVSVLVPAQAVPTEVAKITKKKSTAKNRQKTVSKK